MNFIEAYGAWNAGRLFCAALRLVRSAMASTVNACGASSGVMISRLMPRLTSVQGMKVSICTPPAGQGIGYPRKERPENKIDEIVALIMAISRAITPGQSLVIGADYELVAL